MLTTSGDAGSCLVNMFRSGACFDGVGSNGGDGPGWMDGVPEQPVHCRWKREHAKVQKSTPRPVRNYAPARSSVLYRLTLNQPSE